MATKTTFRIMDFSGGINEKVNATMIRDNQTPDAMNCYIEDGSIIKRSGVTKYNATPVVDDILRCGHRFYRQNNSAETLVVSGTKLYRVPTSGASVEVDDNLSGSLTYSFNTYIGNVYYTARETVGGGIYKYDGTTSTTFTAPGSPAAKMIVSHDERMWAANTNTYRSRVYWSAAFDPSSWQVQDDFIEVAQDDGDEITGIVPFLANLLIFKTNSIWMLVNTYDPAGEMQLLKKVTDKGCIATGSIAVGNNRVYFLGKDGFYEFDGVSAKLISQKVQSSFDEINMVYVDKVTATFHKNKYKVSYTKEGSIINDTQLMYDVVNYSWSKNSGKYAESNHLLSLNGGDDKNDLISLSSSTNGQIYNMDDSDSDDGDGINFYYYTKWFSLEVPESKKKPKKLWVYAETTGSYNLGVTYYYDLQSIGTNMNVPLSGGGAEWGTAVWDTDVWAGVAMTTDRNSVRGKGRYFRYKFYNANKDEPVTIYGLSSIMKVRRAK